MAAKLPYVPAPGLIEKLLPKIVEASTPDRFTSDFLETKLGMSGGSAKALIPLLKKLSFLNPDGTPTGIYSSFRSEGSRGAAMASALKHGYAELFERNEYAHELTRPKLADLVNQVTGAEKDNKVDQLTVSTFVNLNKWANFEQQTHETAPKQNGDIEHIAQTKERDERSHFEPQVPKGQSFGMNLAYTINLNLPESTNPEVFNAIFKALKENLLTEE